MPKRFELLVFDWDGTLMDSTAAIAGCIQAAARDLGLPVPDHATASFVIGLGLQDALAHAVPQLSEADYPKMIDRYRYHFLARDVEVPLFVGTVAMLAELSRRNHILAVATGKSTKGLERALQVTGLAQYFSATRCADQCSPKPAPDMLNELMEEFAVTAETTLMIGDTSHDMQMAANAGVSAVAVSYGAHSRESLMQCKPIVCIDSTTELTEWLKRNA